MVALVLFATARPTVAGVVLSPTSFTSLGSFAGGVSYNVDTLTVTMTSSAGTYTGVTSPDGSAVFTFDDITFDASRFMTVTVARPFALLSRGSAVIAGEIDATAGRPDNSGCDIQIGANSAVSITGQVISNGGVGTPGSSGSPGGAGAEGSGGAFGSAGDPGGSASGQSPGSDGQGASGAIASGGPRGLSGGEPFGGAGRGQDGSQGMAGIDGVAGVVGDPGFNGSSGTVGQLSIVPEPSISCMALAGLACGGYSMWRRRKRS
jgi:hypothetical protein